MYSVTNLSFRNIQLFKYSCHHGLCVEESPAFSSLLSLTWVSSIVFDTKAARKTSSTKQVLHKWWLSFKWLVFKPRKTSVRKLKCFCLNVNVKHNVNLSFNKREIRKWWVNGEWRVGVEGMGQDSRHQTLSASLQIYKKQNKWKACVPWNVS